MNVVIPLLSLVGPIYFALRGFSLESVLVWAAVWTGLRFIAVWKQAFASLAELDSDEPPSWLDRHRSVAFAGVFIATLIVFEATHVVVYWTICRLMEILN